MTVTIKDVAAKAGVARSTVSKVISDSPTISDRTKARVREVMRELNYYPNRLAQGFAHQKAYTIGVLMAIEQYSAYRNPYSFEILCGIEESANHRNYNVSLHNLLHIEQQKEHLARLISEKRVDGFILHASESVKPVVTLLNEKEIPCVLIGAPPFSGRYSWVDVDNQDAGYQAATHLIKQGYKRISYIGGPGQDTITQSRYQGVESALNQAGLSMSGACFNPVKSARAGSYSFVDILQQHKTDAVVAADTLLALGVLQSAIQQKIKIPDHLGVIGFDNLPISELSHPPLTVVDVDLFGLGQEAADTLFQLIQSPGKPMQKRLLSANLISRHSTR